MLWTHFKNWFESETGTAVKLNARVIPLGDPHLSSSVNSEYTKHTLKFY